MPIAIVLTGLAGSYYIAQKQIVAADNLGDQQIKSSKNIAAAQARSDKDKAVTDRRLKLLELFYKDLSSGDKKSTMLQ